MATDLTITVKNIPTLCSLISLTAYKEGVRVPLGNKILNPNNGLRYSKFFEAVHAAHIYSQEEEDAINKTLSTLQSYNMEFSENKNRKKLKFIIRQLELLADKNFTTAD